MKTSILGLLFLGLTSLTFSQNEMAFNDKSTNIHEETLKTGSSTIELNQISKRITAFQNVVSKYDITSKPIYRSNKSATYTVVFKEAKNKITNVYNHDGEVISGEQKFEDIKLPYIISVAILKEYPGWSINAVHCSISYEKDRGTLVSYKIKIKNGTKSKTIKVVK
ncbi:hypothetical protein A9Q87_08880 [Flavobacteriales bacterium 34_180_T64]|nr:hypothetical protein A9Q87_08880 [Flavobacteriales bacterium 34_180_T64]